MPDIIGGSVRPTTNTSHRRLALVAALGLLLMAVLAPFAKFGVLDSLVVETDGAQTVSNLLASIGLFRMGIAAFMVTILLDLALTCALYVLLRPISETIALVTAWLRLAFAAVFAAALTNLLNAADLLNGIDSAPFQDEQVYAQVLSAVSAFDNGWQIGLAVFGLYLFGVGSLLFRLALPYKILGALVIVSGAGYLVDAFATILVADYSMSVGAYTFVGEALLIPWLFWVAWKGLPSTTSNPERGHDVQLTPGIGATVRAGR